MLLIIKRRMNFEHCYKKKKKKNWSRKKKIRERWGDKDEKRKRDFYLHHLSITNLTRLTSKEKLFFFFSFPLQVDNVDFKVLYWSLNCFFFVFFFLTPPFKAGVFLTNSSPELEPVSFQILIQSSTICAISVDWILILKMMRNHHAILS